MEKNEITTTDELAQLKPRLAVRIGRNMRVAIGQEPDVFHADFDPASKVLREFIRSEYADDPAGAARALLAFTLRHIPELKFDAPEGQEREAYKIELDPVDILGQRYERVSAACLAEIEGALAEWQWAGLISEAFLVSAFGPLQKKSSDWLLGWLANQAAASSAPDASSVSAADQAAA
jgi:hypothetical protein